MSSYKCNKCGAEAYYDGRMGDGPILVCGCDRQGEYIDDGRGGYYDNNARPIKKEPTPDYSREDD